MNEESRKWWALGAIGFSLLAVGVDATILNVALPTVSTDLNASTSQLQWIVDAFTLVLAAALLPAGLLGDKFGRKKLLMASLVLFGAASLWCAYSGSAGNLIAARAVLGLAAAFLTPLSTSVLLNLFETEQERTKAIGVIAVSQMLGLPLGPIIGGALLNHFWWGSVFLINVPLVLLGVLAVAKLVPESRGSEKVGIDFVGVVLSSVGLTALTFGAIEAGEKGWGSTETVLSLAGGAAVLALFVWWEFRVTAAAKDPLVDLTLFRERGFVWGSILSTIVSFAMFGLMFTLPQYFQSVRGADALGSGVRLLPLIGGLLVGASVINKLPQDAGTKTVPALGFVLVGAGLFMGTYTDVSTGYGFVAVWLVVIGAGLGLAMTRSMSAALNPLPKERSGVGSAVVQALRQVGGAIGVAVLGAVANSSYRGNLDLPGTPEPVVDAAGRSVATGVAVAEKLKSAAMLREVREAFIDAMHTLLYVCSGIGVVAALLALAFMPKGSAAPQKDGEPATDAPAETKGAGSVV
ncbi:DHA2 family efflux MFS transporter permease subunit [Streptomyces sp. B1866]|uniref:DHA2 family efflux MFS transporter permease subunit n=1 Tax=Streptomyces sp. B1866 TaxID=3075431 RepID=UPI0028904F0F|nr:DHA2 family efflux MFS transporter permease subunit [Streptomyces sp. B1866]MDT3397642.1 DHA2 family efflux MFS transporter permease subunit [Streptomyces sp. B1866]